MAGVAAGADDWRNQSLKPYNDLEQARKLLTRKSDPAALEKQANVSSSFWVRAEASRLLASHYAGKESWSDYHRHVGRAGACARLQHASHSGQPRDAKQALADSFASFAKGGKLCRQALQAAATAGFLRDDEVWNQIRLQVNARKSSVAKRLLPLLKEDKASTRQLNNAIQNATARIRGKHGLDTRVKQQLLAVSAIVAARRRPTLAGERWGRFAPHVARQINDNVWPTLGLWAAQDHAVVEALSYYRQAPLAAHRRIELDWRVRAAMRQGQWQEVLDTIEAMEPENAALTAWRFWQAHAHEQLGHARIARSQYRQLAAAADDYYGIIAAHQIGIRLRPGTARPAPAIVKRLESNADVNLAIALGVLGRTGDARKIWRFLHEHLSAPELLAASELAERRGWHLGAINAADKAAPLQSSFQQRFPLPYQQTIEQRSEQFGLDPAFVYALIRQESRFDLAARSGSGARGLMQIMPNTARAVSRKYKYTRYHLSRLTRLDTNVIIGTRYLADLDQRWNKDPILVAASYNAGPARARNWLRSSRGVNKLVFVETIPFTETRLYVKAVLAGQSHYALVFNGTALSWLADAVNNRYS